jgi:hypothetical protein
MAQWEIYSIHDIVQKIHDDIVVLPVIQRNLVWDEDKMELLFDSLIKGNSFGGIMALEDEKGSQPLFAFRRFSREGEIQDSDLPDVLNRTTFLIIDGQQRLQTFYMGLTGSANGKSLYFNLFSQGDFEFEFARQASDLTVMKREDGNETSALWYLVRDLYARLSKTHDAFKVGKEIASNHNIQDTQSKELISSNVVDFYSKVFILNTLGISNVNIDKENPDLERRRMVELFRRLNDGGTRLSALDLAASSLKGFDYRLEAFLRRDIPRYADIGFGQDEVVKLLFLLRDNSSKEVTDIAREDADFAVANADRILKTLDVVRQLLIDAELYQYYRSGGRSVIPLYFVAYHIFHKDLPTERLSNLYTNYDTNNPDFTNLKRWLYLSILNGVFSRGKGWIPYRTGVNKILNIVRQYRGTLFPTDQIFAMYEAHPLVFSRELSVQRLPQWDMSFVFYLIYGCRSLAGRDIDHIQPKSLLEAAQAPSEKIHSVSNFQLLDEDTNRAGKRAKELKEWIKDWGEAERSQYLSRHLIPQTPELWSLDHFDEFLNQRSQMIIEKIQQAIPSQSFQAQATSQPQGQALASKPWPVPVKTGAATLTNKQRDPEAWLNGVADDKGYGKEFRQIVDAARSLGLYARFQNAWWVVMITPPNKRNQYLFEFGTELSNWICHDRIAHYLDLPVELVKEKLDFGTPLQRQDVGLWIENLSSLFSAKKADHTSKDVADQADSSGLPLYSAMAVATDDDLEVLKNNLPDELRNHPILSDHTTWDDYFVDNKYGGPTWSRRISHELDLAGIYTIADMALLVMVLGLRVSHKKSWGNIYVFDRTFPTKPKPTLRTKNFGPWSWKMTLSRLQSGGFNWQEYVVK